MLSPFTRPIASLTRQINFLNATYQFSTQPFPNSPLTSTDTEDIRDLTRHVNENVWLHADLTAATQRFTRAEVESLKTRLEHEQRRNRERERDLREAKDATNAVNDELTRAKEEATRAREEATRAREAAEWEKKEARKLKEEMWKMKTLLVATERELERVKQANGGCQLKDMPER